MSSAMLGPGVDRDLASHVAIAIRVYRAHLKHRGLAEPPALAALEAEAVERFTAPPELPGGDIDRSVSDDDLRDREYLSRGDCSRLAGVSVRTLDRWLKSGLVSVKVGGCRRVARADLDRFLQATQDPRSELIAA